MLVVGRTGRESLGEYRGVRLHPAYALGHEVGKRRVVEPVTSNVVNPGL
jgi:hypothetical protein